jgi:hypothetical protein
MYDVCTCGIDSRGDNDTISYVQGWSWTARVLHGRAEESRPSGVAGALTVGVSCSRMPGSIEQRRTRDTLLRIQHDPAKGTT